MKLFPIFTDIVAPVDVNEPCLGPQGFLGTCLAGGCYLPGQRLLFGGQYRPIDEAARAGVQTVTSLAPSWQLGDAISHVKQPVEYFMVGDEVNDIYVIETAGGQQISVTHTHPLVTSEGDIITAEEVRPGQTTLYTKKVRLT